MNDRQDAAFPTDDPAWELDSIFSGGADSEEFEEAADALATDLEAMRARLDELPELGEAQVDEAELQSWVTFCEELERLSDRRREASAFAGCVAVTHTDDARAMRLPRRLNAVRADFKSLYVELEARLRQMDDAAFDQLVSETSLKRCRLYLEELREQARDKMGPRLESLAVDLNRDGLHAWSQAYDRISADLQVEVPDEEGDGTRTISVGQAKNLLSHPNRQMRRAAYEGWQEAWQGQAPLLAMVLNSIIGAEQTLYERRGGDELTEPLRDNRVKRQTIEAMFSAADDFKDPLVEYMQAKARLLGLEKLAWFDLNAPIGREETSEVTYQEAQRFIVEQVSSFSEEMADFYRRALADQWVEVEDRTGKAQGGFCTSLPVSRQIRIFMTFGNTHGSMQTLAHELGHAYHGWLMRRLGAFERRVPMGLAETASTLSEALVEAAALERATGAERLALLDERLQSACTFLINIPARFRLERAMHEARSRGELDEELLTEKTREIFGDAYGDGVEAVDPSFWASKLHFFNTSRPFYNFPYTFGYLFSSAVYRRARERGPEYAEEVDALLVDSGRLTAEEIGERYLDADLTSEDFWADAAADVRRDVADYVERVDQMTST
ncbi:MAG: M3 family oligoendopeptidase [Persicimonas sp.]